MRNKITSKIHVIVFMLSMVFAVNGNSAEVEKYPEAVVKKSAEIIESLEINDSIKTERLFHVVASHLNSVRNWHNQHPASTVPSGINPRTGERLTELDRQIIADSAMPDSVHRNLMNGLRADLTEAQVEQVLNKYTVGKVDFTMRGYKAIVPDLTAEEEAQILAYLKEAREMAVDYKSMKEISAIFEIYKTKCEQHLIKNGRDWRALYKAFVKSLKENK